MVLEIADRGPCAASSDAGRAPRRRDARIHPAPGERARCRPGDARGLEVSLGCLLQDQLVQRQVGNRSAQPRVLSLEILQSLDLIALEPAKLLAPAVVRDLRNPIERTASATLCPCDTSTSTWRSFPTISSGLCLFLGIVVLLGSKGIPQGGPLQRGRINGRVQLLGPVNVPLLIDLLLQSRVEADRRGGHPGDGESAPANQCGRGYHRSIKRPPR